MMIFPGFFKVKFLREMSAGTTPEPCRDFGRAALPRRPDIKAAQQRSPTSVGSGSRFASNLLRFLRLLNLTRDARHLCRLNVNLSNARSNRKGASP